MKSRDELIHELAREGLRKLMQTNIQVAARIDQARLKLAEAQGDEMLAIEILGNPVEQERDQMKARELHRAHMKQQREEQEFAPIAVDSYIGRNR